MPEFYIGLMSGTSMDAIDAAVVDFGGSTPALVASHSEPLDPATKRSLLHLCQRGDNELDRMARLDIYLGRLFAAAALAVLNKSGVAPTQISAIGSHGQTIRHEPSGSAPFSIQIGNPSVIAEASGITTVADFRARDIAAGGQGAPLAPAFHNAVFRSTSHDRAVINIGGIANITSLPAVAAEDVTGFDIGPGNVLMDSWASLHLNVPLDRDGQWAAGGTVNDALLTVLLKDPYFRSVPPKSTGREYFNLAWVNRALEQLPTAPSPQDVQATLSELTAMTICEAIKHHSPNAQQVLLCGGGVHNLALVGRITSLLPGMQVASTATLGVHPDWLEAMAFAWLARQTLAAQPGNLPSVTGATHPAILGGIYR